ncbi:hypothetical protein R3P38DRAFT_3186250 [Favolaschia claudopus]|uniref:Uncharacterized protein n=1 Tax=Favolaschia claudopus TaxID=2862362 RepID=A0AAW0C261_9AGAR
MQTTITKFFPVLRTVSVPPLRSTVLRASAPRRKIQALITNYTSDKLRMPPTLPDVDRYFLRPQYRNRDLPALNFSPLPFPNNNLDKKAVEGNRRAIAYEVASAAPAYRKYWDRFGASYTEDGEKSQVFQIFPTSNAKRMLFIAKSKLITKYSSDLMGPEQELPVSLTRIIPAEAWYLYRHVGDGTLHFRASHNSPWLAVYELSVMKDIAEEAETPSKG